MSWKYSCITMGPQELVPEAWKHLLLYCIIMGAWELFPQGLGVTTTKILGNSGDDVWYAALCELFRNFHFSTNSVAVVAVGGIV